MEVNMLIYVILGFVVGLVVGWNFLPQPQFICDLFGGGKCEKPEHNHEEPVDPVVDETAK